MFRNALPMINPETFREARAEFSITLNRFFGLHTRTFDLNIPKFIPRGRPKSYRKIGTLLKIQNTKVTYVTVVAAAAAAVAAAAFPVGCGFCFR